MRCGCGFDNTPGPNLGDPIPERCEGCGIPIRPSDDDHPPRGGRIERGDEPVEVDNGLLVEQDYDWGRGIGAEPHGYYTTKSVTIIDEECPRCGFGHAERDWVSDGIVAGLSVECLACGHTLEEAFYD